jgi:hypothetical protein
LLTRLRTRGGMKNREIHPVRNNLTGGDRWRQY